MVRTLITTAALLSCLAPTLATAQTATPVPASTPFNLPTLPPQSGVNGQVLKTATDIVRGILQQQQNVSRNSVHGPVTYFRRYDMQVLVGNNTYRSVHLHQGTEIDPRGTSIQNGMVVDVQGRGNNDGSLEADRITVINR